uniref:Formin-like protein 11 n=1 Tax=Nicotiana tabacum TaxID=4097 RepID=A0A1S3XXR5_TOBAC|nr:PREDICTED: formin-like protein 11 [Nicotiana tabacum]
MVLVDEGEASGEEAPLQRRKRSSLAQSDAQPGALQNLTSDEVEALLGETGLIENVDSRFPTFFVASGPRSSDPEPLLPPTTEPITINSSSTTVASSPSIPMGPRPLTLVAPSPPATTTSPSPVPPDQERGASPPRSPDHGNLGHNYSTPSPDPRGRRSATLSISKECHLLSKPVELANYPKSLASEKD